MPRWGNYTFDFYNVVYNELHVRRDGFINFQASTGYTGTNADLSQGGGVANEPMIAALWDDLVDSDGIGDTGALLWQAKDVGGANERLVLQWEQVGYADYTTEIDPITFQAVLYGDGRIQLNYLDLDSYTGNIDLIPDDDEIDESLFDDTGGIGATVGIWGGAVDAVAVDPGVFLPGPHSFLGSDNRFVDRDVVIDGQQQTIRVAFSELDSNDSYLRMAWDTGGAAWDVGVVGEFGATSPEANALRDAVVDSLSEQILRADAAGKVFRSDQVLLALNLGGEALDGTNGTNNEGFVADDGTYTLDFDVNRNDVFTIGSEIQRTSNSIPDDLNDPANPVEEVFQSGRIAGVDELQVGFSGSQPSYVASNTSVLISTDGTPGIGPNTFGYVAEKLPTPEFEDIGLDGVTGNLIPSLENINNGVFLLDSAALGSFAINFYGEEYDHVHISTNGLLTFGSSNKSPTNLNLTTWRGPKPSIAVLWDFLKTNNSNSFDGGSVYWAKKGAGQPDERLIIQWDKVRYDSVYSEETITFQAILYRDGRIQFNYQDLDSSSAGTRSNGNSATVGIIPAPNTDLQLVIDTLDGTNPIPDGTYVVELFFAEINSTARSGSRVFDVVLEGTTVLNDYNIFSDYAEINTDFNPGVEYDTQQLGRRDGIVKRFAIDVTGGTLEVDLVSEFSSLDPLLNELLNGLRVLESNTPADTTRVSEVVISSSASGSDRSYYELVNELNMENGDQLRALGFQGANTIEITFSEAANVPSDSLTLRSMKTGDLIAASYLSGSGTTHSWLLDGGASFDDDDQILIAFSDSVTNVANGTALDGEWYNPRTLTADTSLYLVSEFPSGNGIPGGDFRFVFNTFMDHITGDFDGSGVVAQGDMDIVLLNWGAASFPGFVDALSDGTFDGIVSQNELDNVLLNWGEHVVEEWQDLLPLAIGDLNGDGMVSQGDMDLVLLNWGTSNASALEDALWLELSLVISQNELDAVLLHWGS